MIIAIFALSTLSAVVYYDDAIAGKGGGGNGGGDRGGDRGSKGGTSDSAKKGSVSNTSPDPGSSRLSYNDWLSDLIRE